MTDALWDALEPRVRAPVSQDLGITVCFLIFLHLYAFVLTMPCSVELYVCTASYGGAIVPPGSPDEQLCGKVLLFRGASQCACQPGGRFFSSTDVNGRKSGRKRLGGI